MGIKKDPNKGTWIAHYSKRHPLTRQPKTLKRINIKSRAEARKVEEELILKVHESFKKQEVPSWHRCIEEFIQFSRDNGLTLKTIENRELCLKAHTLNDWGKRTIDTIQPMEIRKIINTKLENRSPSQKKNLLKYIRLCFSYALEKGYIQKNPTPLMKFKICNKIKQVLKEEQVRILLNTAKEMNVEWYPHWALALYTGMRNGELYALTWDKINLEKRLIKVNCSWNNKGGFKSTKSGDDRFVEIAPRLVKILQELKQETISNFVLPRIDKWDKGEQARELRMFLAGLGLPSVRFHDLRATWATIMLSNGIAPIKVMKMGGWKDIKTMQVYTRLAGIDIRGITENLTF